MAVPMRHLQLLRHFRQLRCNKMSSSVKLSSESSGTDKLYEFRTYTVRPGNMSQLLKTGVEPLKVRFQHSKCLGYWISEIGGLNELHHLWEYDSYQHRADVRKSLAADPSWVEKAKPMIDLFETQTNLSARVYPWSDVKEVVEPAGGAFFYYKFVFDNQATSEEIEGAVKQFINGNNLNTLSVLVEEVGANTNQTIHCIVHSAGLESSGSPLRIPRENWDDLRSLTLQIHSRIMNPAPWSALK